MKNKKSTHVSEKKKKIVDELSKLIKSNRTILIASIKNLPASQFQEICKKLREKAVVKVPRKNLIIMALDSSGKEEAKKLKEKINSDIAILFSNLDVFDLASELLENKIPAKAKAGQESPKDIEIQPGPTDLVPGPIISELGAMGIQIEIKEGKINIKTAKVVAKKGEKISQGASDLMTKLNIKPFSIGFIPLAGLDISEGKLYSEINIDKEGIVEELKNSYSKGLAFAVAIAYPCSETIGLLIGKAGMHAKALEKLLFMKNIPEENKSEGKEI